MSKNYSKKETIFPIDPDLEIQANETINQLGGNYLLEGASKTNENRCQIYYRDLNTGCIGCVFETIREINKEEPSEILNYVENDILNLATWATENHGQNYLLEGAKKTGDGYCKILMRDSLTDELKLIFCPLDARDKTLSQENIQKYEQIIKEEKKTNFTSKLIKNKKNKANLEINSEYFIFYK